MDELSNLGALLNPNTNPNIHYLSPIPKPIKTNNAYIMNMIPDDEFSIETEISNDIQNITEDYIIIGNGHLKVNNNGDMNNYKVPPNSTRDMHNVNKSMNGRRSFNYKRLSQKLLKINTPVIADVDKKSETETDDENEYFNDTTYNSSDTYHNDNDNDNDNHKLNITETKLERLEKLIQSFKMLQKELPNLLEINANSSVLEIKIPNINKYENWDLNDIMFWIKCLENGRFKKYEEQLMLGFTEKGISSKELPNLNTADLSAPPFNIKVFRDKRDLIAHFKNLKKND